MARKDVRNVSMNDSQTLSSCPFCGGEARLISSAPDWYLPACMNRECACDWTDSYPTKAKAIAAWNTRAELVSGTCRLDETASYSNANEVIHLLECSECGRTCEHVNGSYPRCPHCGAKAVER